MRLRNKIFLTVILIQLIVSVPASIFYFYHSRDELKTQTLATCRLLAGQITAVARDELLTGEIPDALFESLDQLTLHPLRGLINVYIINKSGSLVAQLKEKKSETLKDNSHLRKIEKQKEDLFYKNLFKVQKSVEKTGKEFLLKAKDFYPVSNANSAYKPGDEILRLVYPIIFTTPDSGSFRLGATFFDFDTQAIYAPLEELKFFMISQSVILILLMLGFTFVAARSISRPIEKLSQAVSKIGQGHLGHSVEISSSFEINNLSQNINQMSSSLAENQGQLLAKAMLDREVEIARNIQLGVLPPNSKCIDFEFYGQMHTASKVGGDYYDFIIYETERQRAYYLVIGDVSGHGLGSGLIMLMVQTALHTALKLNPTLDSKSLFMYINNQVRANIKILDELKYMTFTVVKINDDGHGEYFGLHLDLLLYRQKTQKIETLETDGMWLGVLPNAEQGFEPREFHMDKNDILLVYTDGFTETRLSESTYLDDEGLKEIYHSACQNGDLEQISEQMWQKLQKLNFDKQLLDDICFALLKRN